MIVSKFTKKKKIIPPINIRCTSTHNKIEFCFGRKKISQIISLQRVTELGK